MLKDPIKTSIIKQSLDILEKEFSFAFLKEELINQINTTCDLKINSRAGKLMIMGSLNNIQTQNIPENLHEFHMKLKILIRDHC